ncbi:DNA polymerase III subunit delta' [Salinisphaera sp.]|uniref:DNA polymerase III subunit delta' n=1 Tax=Salinisphaera sp. TaxID=1914330 RepID=UPI002D7A10BB|nr:DNA polymerase III subunit delta' [Salinisphaera sp.]HET7314062.1 DNA polymerase III subunit delta' [Salinisphaera sp.]
MNAGDDTGPALPWHAALWRHMAGGLAADRVAHGLLIAGTPGVGKRSFARRLVSALLCRDRTLGGDACGVCAGCRQRAAGTHPDISRLTPEDGGKAIKVEQVRRFSHALHLTPQYATGRIGWIDPADALSISAANSLLKTLEEPPAGCHIVLVSDRVSALLPTIRSRCQIWTVPAADPAVAREWLTARAFDPARIDDDRLRTPLALLARRDADAGALIEQWDKDLARLLARRVNPVSAAERAIEAERRLWVDWLYRRCNDLLLASLEGGAGTVDHALAEGARRVGRRRLEAWSRRVAEVARTAATNADWRLVVESVFIELSQYVAEATDPHER